MAWNAVNTDTVHAYTQDIERSRERGLMRNRACYAAKTWTMDKRTPRPLEMVEGRFEACNAAKTCGKLFVERGVGGEINERGLE